ncbi:MAG: hypothetical protein IPP45_18735 [Sphingomonadales bacterium]|jgi:tetratricopeptide (TPR) repeat protein|nr:hypothetical protein [Sphingomonadales bacterium]TNE33986.1 MAG: hypothetical protein EP350_02785 [Alphaproteobacteria bacterium]
MTSHERIDGWKAISRHLGRDRSTVIRWAQERGLPVHRVPGGKNATIHAYVDELDAWMDSDKTEVPRSTGKTVDGPQVARVSPDSQSAARSLLRSSRKTSLARLIVAALVATAILSFGWNWGNAVPKRAAQVSGARIELPKNPAIAETYLEARRQWALRTPESLARARELLGDVTAREPDYAPAWAALADAWLLTHTYGGEPSAMAFAEGEGAADIALRLDSNSWMAHRAKGFVAYWWRWDPVGAGLSFRRALELAPGDAQTHFWYANILSDNGEAEKALAHYSTALALDPSSLSIQIYHGWAQLEAGNEDRAREIYSDLEKRASGNAIYQINLGDWAASKGDWQGYVRHFSAYARLKGERPLLVHKRLLELAAERGDHAIAQQALALELELANESRGANYDRSTMLASVIKDRSRVLEILNMALARKEQWPGGFYFQTIRKQWPGDAQIERMLKQLRAPPVE